MPDDPEHAAALRDVAREGAPVFSPQDAATVRLALDTLNEAGVPYLVGGAFAKHRYTGIWRDTKDVDLFLAPGHLAGAFAALRPKGFDCRVLFHQWLAKAIRRSYDVDLIFGTGNGQLAIDEGWYRHARPGEVAGAPVRFIPPEELLVSKLYIAERYRFDGADVVHIVHGVRGELDWDRVLERLGPNWELLLLGLVLFDYVYPSHTDYLPKSVRKRLWKQARRRWRQKSVPTNAFRGTLLDPFSFIVDLEDWGYEDRRDLRPLVDDEGRVVERAQVTLRA